MNYNIKLNLLKLEGAGVMKIKGRTATKQCVVIPVTENDIYLSLDESMNIKSAYLSAVAWENREESKFGDTHSVRLELSKQVRESMSKEEQAKIPYFGNMKPFERKTAQAIAENTNAPTASAASDDDLPF